jgi:hypothetical protein
VRGVVHERHGPASVGEPVTRILLRGHRAPA